ncbi:hypothetical protein CCE01nite_10390 [Cellulomonas cellasea]|uniref:Uncharacterized protein n=1 Tax=Cellulomonas cellasea TaxID=43670 RepID=A0A4Y3KW04_9CELL|nr:hypothetical protein CCE01nite_10390 [Cellulomonas cellasea]
MPWRTTRYAIPAASSAAVARCSPGVRDSSGAVSGCGSCAIRRAYGGPAERGGGLGPDDPHTRGAPPHPNVPGT